MRRWRLPARECRSPSDPVALRADGCPRREADLAADIRRTVRQGAICRLQASTWKTEPSRLPDGKSDIKFDPASQTLQVADGMLTGVPEDVWNFEVSGMDVIPKWLGYRMSKPAGRAASSDSPLDHIRPTTWSPEWSTELVEIVAAIKGTLALVPDGIALLEEIIAGPLIAAAELPPVPDALRKPPATGKACRGAGRVHVRRRDAARHAGRGDLLMTFKPNLSVKEGLDHLAKRLDPIIADEARTEPRRAPVDCRARHPRPEEGVLGDLPTLDLRPPGSAPHADRKAR